jgi:VWFA-related protein
MSLTRTLLFFLALALIATLALLVDGVALFAQTQPVPAAQSAEPHPQQQPAAQQPPQQQPAQPPQAQPQKAQPQEPVPDGFRFKSSVELINVSATVVDSAERFVPNLHKEDFVLYEDDKVQPITHFSDERVPVSLGILLDISGSMEGEKFRNATSAIERFLRDLLGPEDEVFLYTFNDHVQMVQGWTKDRDLVMRELRRQYPAGGTAMYDAVAEAIPYAQRGHNRKKAIVIISDGNDNKSATSVGELRNLIRETEVLIYAIGIDGDGFHRTNYNTGGGRGGRWPPGRWPQQTPSTQFQIQWPMPGGGGRPPMGPRFPPQFPQPPRYPPQYPQRPQSPMDDRVNSHALRELTDDSGGRTEIVKESSDLGPATASIADELSRQYSLAYEPAAPKDGRWHTIRVETKNRDYKVRARRGYMATP